MPGPCKLHFCFVSWFPVRLCYEAALEGDYKAGGWKKELLLLVCFLCFLSASVPVSITLHLGNCSPSLQQNLKLVCNFSNTCRMYIITLPQRHQHQLAMSPPQRYGSHPQRASPSSSEMSETVKLCPVPRGESFSSGGLFSKLSSFDNSNFLSLISEPER